MDTSSEARFQGERVGMWGSGRVSWMGENDWVGWLASETTTQLVKLGVDEPGSQRNTERCARRCEEDETTSEEEVQNINILLFWGVFCDELSVRTALAIGFHRSAHVTAGLWYTRI